jgi:hypothetical protein
MGSSTRGDRDGARRTSGSNKRWCSKVKSKDGTWLADYRSANWKVHRPNEPTACFTGKIDMTRRGNVWHMPPLCAECMADADHADAAAASCIAGLRHYLESFMNSCWREI